jgi:hypothetical protein
MSQKRQWKRKNGPGGAGELWKTANCWLRRQQRDKVTAGSEAGEESRVGLHRGKI